MHGRFPRIEIADHLHDISSNDSRFLRRLPDKKLLQDKLHEFYELAREQESLPDVKDQKPTSKKQRKG